MSLSTVHIRIALIPVTIAVFLLMVSTAGAYSQSYYQSSYYSQSGYYSQTYYQSTYSAGTTFSSGVPITGNAYVVGALSKGSGSFVIDHPLDPKNKLLYHSFVESPDVKNIYDGVATLDETGSVTITLPDYFEALNRDFRYLVTPMYEPMPNLYIKKRIHKRFLGLFGRSVFDISGGEPNSTISWQVTGVRKDPLITANPIIPEVGKSPTELVDVGECLFEPLCR